jgi:hypothetical protein
MRIEKQLGDSPRPRAGSDAYPGRANYRVDCNDFYSHRLQIIGGDLRGGRFAAQLQYRVNQNDIQAILNNVSPIYFYLAGDGKWINCPKSAVKAQAKLVILMNCYVKRAIGRIRPIGLNAPRRGVNRRE